MSQKWRFHNSYFSLLSLHHFLCKEFSLHKNAKKIFFAKNLQSINSVLVFTLCIGIFGITLHLYQQVMFSRNQTLLYTRLHSFPVGKSFQVITTNFQIKLKGIQTETGMLCTNVSVGSRTFVPFFLSFGIPRITIQSWPPSTTRILL